MTDSVIEAYCVKCKAMRPVQDAAAMFMSNGRPATRGKCAVCGGSLFKIGKTTEHEGLTPPPASPSRVPVGGSRRKIVEQSDVGAGEAAATAPVTEPTEAYCVVCKAKRPITTGLAVFLANGRPAVQGTCGVCGRKLVRLGRTHDHEGLVAPAVSSLGTRKTSTTSAKAKRTKTKAKLEVETPKRRTKSASASEVRPRSLSGKLVIVESPAKARTVGRFLGSGYDVRASIGHVRDLLRSKLSVDLDHDFSPTYRIPNEKRDLVRQIRDAAARSKEIFLATDPDREGEAIAWHLIEAAEIPVERTRRVVFHEITRNAVSDAFTHSRAVDMDLVNAQQARRILDRLVGYQISPLLWRRVRSRLSAGRVQSVALRLIVEREREIAAFEPSEYWSIDCEVSRPKPRLPFLARLVKVRGQEPVLGDAAEAREIVGALEQATYTVSGVKRSERRRRPAPPFTTSTLQQDAAQRLGMTAQRTMRLAQDLYEGIEVAGEGNVGLITYMRTDSVNVSSEAQADARTLIAEKFGSEYVPAEPNVYKVRAKNAQEAHEAVRPTSVFRQPAAIRKSLGRDQFRLYELIWQRFMASQMAPALYDTATIEVAAGPQSERPAPYLLRANGSKLRFPGFLVVYAGAAAGSAGRSNGGADEGAGGNGASARSAAATEETPGEGATAVEMTSEPADRELPTDLLEGERLDLLRVLPEQHFTQPPARFTEASLVKSLEENGIGRPSTYAAIIGTILDRGYVERAERKLIPTELGYTVNDLLVKHFDRVFNVGFTAGLEEHLDAIADGTEQLVPVLREFYDFFGPQLESAEASMEKVQVAPERIGEACPECGGDLIIRVGRYGKFVGCANYPTCRYARPLVTKIGVTCPLDHGDLVERRTKRGRVFYGCANYPGCSFTSWKRPLTTPCPHCGGMLVQATKDRAECSVCHQRVGLDAPIAATIEA
jgi:DNA topoisomerase I